VIRDDSVTKLEGVIMASMTGESCPRPQRQQHNGCASKLQILHVYFLFPKMSRIADASGFVMNCAINARLDRFGEIERYRTGVFVLDFSKPTAKK